MSDAASEHPVEQAAALLRKHLGARVWEVRVLARGGGVILQGRARTYYDKQLAQHIIMHGLKLPVAANEIEVHGDRPALAPGGADPE